MDEELLSAEYEKLFCRIARAVKEIEFAMKFAESQGVVTSAILQGIKDRLLTDKYD